MAYIKFLTRIVRDSGQKALYAAKLYIIFGTNNHFWLLFKKTTVFSCHKSIDRTEFDISLEEARRVEGPTFCQNTMPVGRRPT